MEASMYASRAHSEQFDGEALFGYFVTAIAEKCCMPSLDVGER